MDTVVDKVVGLGREAPAARIVLHLEKDDVCLLIAIPPGPDQLQANLFKFKKQTVGERKLQPISFKLPKPVTREKDGVQVWKTCAPGWAATEALLTQTGTAFVQITYRDPRSYRPPVDVLIDHPLAVLAVGVDVHKDSSGVLQFYNYEPMEDLEGETEARAVDSPAQ